MQIYIYYQIEWVLNYVRRRNTYFPSMADNMARSAMKYLIQI